MPPCLTELELCPPVSLLIREFRFCRNYMYAGSLLTELELFPPVSLLIRGSVTKAEETGLLGIAVYD